MVIQSVVVVKLRNRSEVVYPFISLLEFVAPPFLATLYADRARISSVSAIAAASSMWVNKRQNIGDSLYDIDHMMFKVISANNHIIF